MPLTVHYFDFPGRGEVTRLLLAVGGIKFDDKRYVMGGNEWAKLKPKTPFLQLPLLELENGKILAQTNAIEAYAANLAGLIPRDPMDASRVLEAVNLSHEIIEPIYATVPIQDPKARVEKRKEVVANYMNARLQLVDAFVADKLTRSTFLFGDKPCYADLAFFNAMGMLSCGLYEGVPVFSEIFANCPALKKLHNRVASYPSVKAFYDKENDNIRKFYLPQGPSSRL